MRLPRRAYHLAPGAAACALAVLAACDQPTGPEVLAEAKRIDREFGRDPRAAAERLRALMGYQDAYRSQGWAMSDLVAELDGRRAKYRAFVYEFVTVPIDSLDGYRCPRVMRTLVAAEGSRHGFVLRGAGFS